MVQHQWPNKSKDFSPKSNRQIAGSNLLVAKAYARGVGANPPLSLICYKNFITCAKEEIALT